MRESNLFETVLGMSVISLTKHLMETQGLSEDEAYAMLLRTVFYTLLTDQETNLYLESNPYLFEACDKELNEGVDAMYLFVND